MNSVLIDTQNIDEPEWLPRLEEFSLQILTDLGRDDWEVSILLCDDTTIAEFNRNYRDKEGPTDVLSFAQIELPEEIPPSGPFVAGDLVISLDSVKSNAEYFKVSFDEELRRLVIHGILHLSGLDHASNEADEPMLAEQEIILSRHRGGEPFNA